MAHLNCAAFSHDGQYFAFYHTDGKLKIWDTVAGVLKQEYTPNEHLSLPCSALAWVNMPHLMMSPGKKKKRRSEEGGISNHILLLGLKSGSVLLYNLSTASVEGELQGPGLAAAVRSLTWATGNDIYSGCADGTIAHWSLPTKQITSKWRGSKAPISALLAHPSKPLLFSACQIVKMWDRKKHSELLSFSGHASPVFRLLLAPGNHYIVSVAQGDRHINVWSLTEESSKKKSVAASFVLPDQPVFVDVGGNEDTGSARLVAITEGGAMHTFYNHINGKRLPPMKPNLTVQIAAAEPSVASEVDSIPILGALVSREDDSTVHITHGNAVVLRFEKIGLNSSKEAMWLLRKNTKRIGNDLQQPSTSKVKTANDEKAHYVTAAGVKRPRDAGSAKQLPIEQRINNLSVTEHSVASRKSEPSSDSLAQLLAQGLQSSDQKLLRGILLNKENSTVTSTVSRLAPAHVPMLLQELAVLVHWRGWKGEAASRWLHALLVYHGSLVLSCPELPQLLGPLLGLVEARLAQVAPLSRLRGRLSMLLGQMAHGRTASKASNGVPSTPEDELPILHYQDGEDSDSDDLGLDSDGEQWAEMTVDRDEEDETEDEEEVAMVNGEEGSSSEQEEAEEIVMVNGEEGSTSGEEEGSREEQDDEMDMSS